MRRILYSALAALVALMILVPVATAQEEKMKVEETVVVEREGYAPLPKSGGPAAGPVLLPAAALLVGSGVLAYAVLRRR